MEEEIGKSKWATLGKNAKIFFFLKKGMADKGDQATSTADSDSASHEELDRGACWLGPRLF
jgi:hypothetical protein